MSMLFQLIFHLKSAMPDSQRYSINPLSDQYVIWKVLSVSLFEKVLYV